MKKLLLIFTYFFASCLGVYAQSATKPASSYSFTSSLTYRLSTKDKKGKGTSIETQYYFSPNSGVVGMKMGELAKGGQGVDFVIMDIPNFRFYTFMSSKIMMGMNLKSDKFMETIEKENGKISVRKTDQVKTILNWACEGYEIHDEDEKSTIIMWVSKDKVPAIANMAEKMAKSFSGSAAGKQKNYMAYNTHPELVKIASQGRAALGYTITSSKGDVSEMEVIASHPTLMYTFDTTAYKSLF